jgi:hypothetical protein
VPQFDTEVIQAMRNALEVVMTRVPSEHSTPAIKVYLAEVILKATAQGQTRHNELVAAATGQIQVAISLFDLPDQEYRANTLG